MPLTQPDPMSLFQFSETQDPFDIKFDYIFKSVFTRDTPASRGALSSFVSALIGRDVSIQILTANEPPVFDANQRRVRFDIACKTETGDFVNIEMSKSPKAYELERLEYYSNFLHSSQNIQGVKKDYSDLRETYQIGILGESLFVNDPILVHRFSYNDLENRVSLNGKTTIITMEIQKAELLAEKPVEELTTQEAWSTYFAYLTDKEKRSRINEILRKEKGIAMASEVLITITQEERDTARRISELKYELDSQAMLVGAMRESHAEGREEGLEIGREEGRIETIKSLLINGVAAEQIAIALKMPLETVKRILNVT